MTDFESNFKTMVKEAVVESLRELMKDNPVSDRKFPGYMNHSTAAEYLGMTKGQLYNHTRRETIPFIKPEGSNRNMFIKADLDAWMKSNSKRPASEWSNQKNKK